MRLIDADALKELFSEVIGHIAKKPEMNGNLEHMIRASAMVIQIIVDAPTVQPYTTTHDSIPTKTGKNDGDGTSGDCISRQQAIMAIEQHRIAVLEGHKWDEGIEYGYAAAHRHLVDIIENLPSAQPSDSKIENAIRVLQSKYNKALSQDYIRNPIAWALYQTWKEFDR